MANWNQSAVPQHPPTSLRLECLAEGGKGRHKVVAYDGDIFVHSAYYEYSTWYGHAHGQLLMPSFVRDAEAAKEAQAQTAQ